MKTINLIQLKLKHAGSASEALRCSNDFPGVERAVLLEGDRMEVIGDNVNVINLVMLLAGKMESAEMISSIPVLASDPAATAASSQAPTPTVAAPPTNYGVGSSVTSAAAHECMDCIGGDDCCGSVCADCCCIIM